MVGDQHALRPRVAVVVLTCSKVTGPSVRCLLGTGTGGDRHRRRGVGRRAPGHPSICQQRPLHFLGKPYVPGTVLQILNVLSYLILTAALRDRFYFYTL